MQPPPLPLPSSLEEARAWQQALAQRVVLQGDLSRVRYLAALDASHPPRFSRPRGPSVAVAVLWDRTREEVLEVATAELEEALLFPYVPGFLSFREAPLYLAALARLSRPPEALLVDGQGIAHPRGLGIAAHLGVHLELPSLGVAKTRLFGQPEAELPQMAGAAVRLMAKEQVGWVYRSRSGVKPLFISPGHRVGLQACLDFVRSLPCKTRLPEPLRRAHLEAGAARRAAM
ncbi:endonuclease V [Meiothermus sp. QL-1]|uniref:endonuclease V n=1 Tax=Meiothermus sp. QL-1 TaxID=2058095 RepID=UPI000E0A9426|nr:endonuclease V [Meiothermus sp. QL-1]RDI95341.1 endonuclease V [Meiothermus sp. QL-1]